MYARFIKSLSLAFIATIIAFFTACGIIVQWPGASPPDAAAPGLIDLGIKPKTDLPYPMSTTITPNAVPTITTSLPFPNDGEIANSASLTQFGTPLVDDLEAFRLLTYGGGMRRKVTCTGNTAMTIFPLGAVVVKSGGLWKTFTHTTSSAVDPTALAGGAIAASTRYWIYAYDNAGTLAFTASTTGPDSGLRYMTGNASYFFVSTFYVNGASNILKYSQSDAEYMYSEPTAATALLVNGNATTLTGVNVVGAAIPSQATRFKYMSYALSTVANRNYTISGPGTAYSTLSVSVDTGIIPLQTLGEAAIIDSGADQLFYVVSNVAMQLNIYPHGFTL